MNPEPSLFISLRCSLRRLLRGAKSLWVKVSDQNRLALINTSYSMDLPVPGAAKVDEVSLLDDGTQQEGGALLVEDVKVGGAS